MNPQPIGHRGLEGPVIDEHNRAQSFQTFSSSIVKQAHARDLSPLAIGEWDRNPVTIPLMKIA